ncbi:hypothetical protein NDU88_009651 [Pleurodeles waltl]|uniref:Phosphatidylinositol transfer protein N-terminal domain-containing protein n=1 Tax=Pleurodeles waltl TaxID=8319 RepID=A0AAV7PWI9_PLEWA|nr:hypothetical protein NDU88_009651 [Pleurodeles waltl]
MQSAHFLTGAAAEAAGVLGTAPACEVSRAPGLVLHKLWGFSDPESPREQQDWGAEMLQKEYRICMPLSVEEYKIGQLYMISKHSHEQSSDGEGVEVVINEPFEHPVYGRGQYTEKRVHLNRKLPTWIRGFVPKIFYIIEKAWNYYPYTITAPANDAHTTSPQPCDVLRQADGAKALQLCSVPFGKEVHATKTTSPQVSGTAHGYRNWSLVQKAA